MQWVIYIQGGDNVADKDKGRVKPGPVKNPQTASKKDSRLKDRSGPKKNKK